MQIDNSKVLVVQVKIGENDFNNTGDAFFRKIEKKEFIPSVKQWADKCGYDYKLITESSIKNKNFFINLNHCYSSEKLIHIDNSRYEYVIYIDSDIYVSEYTPFFPLCAGLSIIPQRIPEFFKNAKDYYTKDFVDNTKRNYFNAGVFCVDIQTGKKIKNYFLNKMAENNRENIFLADQDILNSWIYQNSCNILDEKWNYIVSHNHLPSQVFNSSKNSFCVKEYIKKSPKINLKETYFLHFAGTSKIYTKELLKKVFNF